jgi:DNA-directed RNA polymerase specialized sigma24 family protein
VEASQRLERLLALILLHQMKGVPQREKALQLSLAGFTNMEIADLLQTKATGVAQLLYDARQSIGKRSSRRKA